MKYVTLTFDLTYYLDFEIFKVKFRNSSITGIVGLIDIKRKVNELETGQTVWTCPLTTHMTLTLKIQGQRLK